MPQGKFEQITMDFLTDLAPTAAGCDLIFIISDRFTKFVRLCQGEKTGQPNKWQHLSGQTGIVPLVCLL